MALYYRRNIRFVAHAHFARFDNKRLLPLEIGIVAVLPEGVRERLMVLLTIDQSGHYMTGKDRCVNREASAASHGEWSQEEAERRARKVVGKDLVAVKGLEMKRYFQSIGIANVVELKSEVYGDCPKFDELDRPEKMPCSRHRDHRDPWRCSRVVSHSFARYIEERRRSDPLNTRTRATGIMLLKTRTRATGVRATGVRATGHVMMTYRRQCLLLTMLPKTGVSLFHLQCLLLKLLPGSQIRKWTLSGNAMVTYRRQCLLLKLLPGSQNRK